MQHSTIISSTTQSDPLVNNNKPIVEYLKEDVIDQGVLADLVKRAEIGKERYGTYLQAHNGRDVLRDLYEEMLDATTYSMQLVIEKFGSLNPENEDEFLNSGEVALYMGILKLTGCVYEFTNRSQSASHSNKNG